MLLGCPEPYLIPGINTARKLYTFKELHPVGALHSHTGTPPIQKQVPHETSGHRPFKS